MALTDNQKLAVQLLNDGRRVGEVANATGLSVAQIKRWGMDKAFMQERYADMTMRFGEASPRAMNVLIEIMEDKEARTADRIKASVEILDRSGFAVRKDVAVNITDNRTHLSMSEDEIRHAIELLERAEQAIDITPEECKEIESGIDNEQ
jgi:hypothetical protein